MSTQSIEQLHRLVTARFRDYQTKLIEERERRSQQLRSEHTIFMHWVFHTFNHLTENLTRDSEEWLKIHWQVSQEFGCPELLKTEQLGRVRREIADMIDRACEALESQIKMACDLAGFTAPLPGIDRYNIVRGKVLRVVVSRLELMEAEGALNPNDPIRESPQELTCVNVTFWRDLESRFRDLVKMPESACLAAMYSREGWDVFFDNPCDERERPPVLELFCLLARSGGSAAGAPSREKALDWWLNLLQDESPRFQVKDVQYKCGWIQNVPLASAEYCIVLAARAFELETAVAMAVAAAQAAQKADPRNPADSDNPNDIDAGPPDDGAEGGGMSKREVIDAFISKITDAGRRITRKDIWTAAGYKDPTEFERFQRSDPRTTRSAAATFKRVLNMSPENFIALLDKRPATK